MPHSFEKLALSAFKLVPAGSIEPSAIAQCQVRVETEKVRCANRIISFGNLLRCIDEVGKRKAVFLLETNHVVERVFRILTLGMIATLPTPIAAKSLVSRVSNKQGQRVIFCLHPSSRLKNKETLSREVAAWQASRNKNQTKADWRFTTADARIKLKRLYPQFQ